MSAPTCKTNGASPELRYRKRGDLRQVSNLQFYRTTINGARLLWTPFTLTEAHQNLEHKLPIMKSSNEEAVFAMKSNLFQL